MTDIRSHICPEWWKAIKGATTLTGVLTLREQESHHSSAMAPNIPAFDRQFTQALSSPPSPALLALLDVVRAACRLPNSAPYSSGDVTVSIPYEVFKEFINARYLLECDYPELVKAIEEMK